MDKCTEYLVSFVDGPKQALFVCFADSFPDVCNDQKIQNTEIGRSPLELQSAKRRE